MEYKCDCCEVGVSREKLHPLRDNGHFLVRADRSRWNVPSSPVCNGRQQRTIQNAADGDHGAAVARNLCPVLVIAVAAVDVAAAVAKMAMMTKRFLRQD